MAADVTAHLGTNDRVKAARGRRFWPPVVGAVVLLAAAVLLARTRPAAPAIERSSLVIGTVTRGAFVHDVAAGGSLVAEQPRLIAAPAAGRVESIEVEPGDQLRAGTVILTLSNRETVRQLLEVESQLAAAEAELNDLSATLQARSLESQSTIRRTEFESQDASRQAEATTLLARDGLVSNLEALRRQEASQEVAARVQTARSRHAALARSADAQLAGERNRLQRLRALHDFHRAIVNSLTIKAESDTTAREILVQEGEWVTEGQRLVRLVEPGRLKALLQVPEAAAHEIRLGQRVTLNARGATLQGEVSRIAAAVDQGTVAVDVRLEGELPAAARPDLSVEGRIEVDRSADALTIERAANAMPATSAQLYRVTANGRTAERKEIRFGAASVDRIVVISGASAGESFVIAGLDGRTDPVVNIE